MAAADRMAVKPRRIRDIADISLVSCFLCKRDENTRRFLLVMAGLVPAIPIIGALCPLIEIAGTSPAMTGPPPRALLLLPLLICGRNRPAAQGRPHPAGADRRKAATAGKAAV